MSPPARRLRGGRLQIGRRDSCRQDQSRPVRHRPQRHPLALWRAALGASMPPMSPAARLPARPSPSPRARSPSRSAPIPPAPAASPPPSTISSASSRRAECSPTPGLVPACRSLDCITVLAGTRRRRRSASVASRAASTPLIPIRATRCRSPLPAATASASACSPAPSASSSAMARPRRSTTAAIERLRRASAARRSRSTMRRSANVPRCSMAAPGSPSALAAIEAFVAGHAEAMDPTVRTHRRGGARLFGGRCLPRPVPARGTAQARRTANGRRMDVLLLPTAPTIYTVEAMQADPIRLNSNLGRYTNFVNLLDCSAIAVAGRLGADGLPGGVTLIGPAFADASLAVPRRRLHRLSPFGMGRDRAALLPASSALAPAADGMIDDRRRRRPSLRHAARTASWPAPAACSGEAAAPPPTTASMRCPTRRRRSPASSASRALPATGSPSRSGGCRRPPSAPSSTRSPRRSASARSRSTTAPRFRASSAKPTPSPRRARNHGARRLARLHRRGGRAAAGLARPRVCSGSRRAAARMRYASADRSGSAIGDPEPRVDTDLGLRLLLSLAIGPRRRPRARLARARRGTRQPHGRPRRTFALSGLLGGASSRGARPSPSRRRS